MIEPFSPAHIEHAAELLAARHRRDLVLESTLGERFGGPTECRSLIGQAWESGVCGAVEVEANTVVGYLLAGAGDGQRGRHCWTQAHHAAYALSARRVALQRLYAHLSGGWLSEGSLHHYTVTPAVDLPLWLALGFAHEQVHAVMDVSAKCRSENEDPSVRLAEPSDMDSPESLLGLINMVHAEPPVFVFTDRPMWDILRSGHSELLHDPDVRNWVPEGM